jgi:hypothetical protein
MYLHKKTEWYLLVHVCQRWRYLVFASPHRLDLCIYCTGKSPVREKLDIWPLLPIKIWSAYLGDNVIAALEHPDRICEICLWNTRSPLDRLVTMMQKPFPELESLHLGIIHGTVPALPNTFLGGSAPHLQSLGLYRIPFPTLPRLLLSCNDLVSLSLQIPHSGYISPETMVTSISALTRLSSLDITFDSLASLPNWRTRHQPPPPLTRAVLPALTAFWFDGVSEYLEDLVARINAPLLNTVCITLFNQPVIGTQQLTQFIGHAPMFMSYNQAIIYFEIGAVSIHCSPIEQYSRYLELKISSIGGDMQVSSMAQICSQLLFLMSRVERLYIKVPLRVLTVNMDDTHWLELFHPFTAVQALYLPLQFWPFIVPALHGLSEESVTDVLPALVGLYLEGYRFNPPKLQAIEPFIAARQRTGHPVTVHHWAR